MYGAEQSLPPTISRAASKNSLIVQLLRWRQALNQSWIAMQVFEEVTVHDLINIFTLH